MCQAHVCMEEMLVATLDQDLEHNIGQSIPGGDACCEHILSKKGLSREP